MSSRHSFAAALGALLVWATAFAAHGETPLPGADRLLQPAQTVENVFTPREMHTLDACR